jgi:hypothetical protein
MISTAVFRIRKRDSNASPDANEYPQVPQEKP